MGGVNAKVGTANEQWKGTRAMRGADVGSDHHLVIPKLRLKLTRYRVAGAGRRLTYDTVRLKSPTVRKTFCTGTKEQIPVPTDRL